jgi:DNA-binding CsgD family transcriptional regulator
MSIAATQPEPLAVRRPASRGDITSYLMDLTRRAGADCYLLFGVAYREGRPEARVVASNWIYDAVELAGGDLFGKLAGAPFAAPPGARPQGLACTSAPDAGPLDGEDTHLLRLLGHVELYCLKLHVGRQRLFLLLSSEIEEQIQSDALSRIQIEGCYALSCVADLVARATPDDLLADRERECLAWVAEGKTTGEVAQILGVTTHTASAYIAKATAKFASSNRTMAVASAIRGGII